MGNKNSYYRPECGKNMLDAFIQESNVLANDKQICDPRQFQQIDLRSRVPFISQFSLENGNVACARASQLTLILHFLDANAGSKKNRIIVARSNENLSLEILLPNAIEGVYYINQQLELGNPVMVGVNHTLNKIVDGKVKRNGQADGEDADHFVVIVGRDFDIMHKQDFYYYYQVGRGVSKRKEGMSSTLNRLYLNKTDYSLMGESWDGKIYTVTDIRMN